MPEQDIEALFRSKHTLNQAVVERLDAADLERIGEMALGQRHCQDRGRAMDILAAAQIPAAYQPLGQVLLNPNEHQVLRARAASLLGRLGGNEAEGILRLALSSPTELIVRIKIVAALGRAGSTDAIAALEAVSDDPDEMLRKQARFSLAVIAYRDGLPGYDLPAAEPGEVIPLEPGAAAPFEIRAAPPGESGALERWLEARPFGLHLSPEHAYLVNCAAERMAVILNAEWAAGNLAAQVLERRLLAGLLGYCSPEDGSYATMWLLFSWPAGGERFNAAAYRTDGTPVLFGAGTSDGDIAQYELAAVRGRGTTAVAVGGRVERSSLVFSTTLSGTTREGQREPLRLQWQERG